MKSIKNEITETFKSGNILTKLIFINVGVFVVTFFIDIFWDGFLNYVSFPASPGLFVRRPWTIISYMFVHGGFWHLLMNMLWLYWFGKMFLLYFNEKQMTAVYILGGFAGAAFHTITGYLLPQTGAVYILGASAAVMSVVFAVVAYNPDFVINLIFIGPVKIKYIGIVVLFLDIAGMASNLKAGAGLADGVAHTAHVGGAAFGLLFGYNIRNGKDITRRFNNILNSLFSYKKSYSGKMNISKRDKFKRTKPKSDWEYNAAKADIRKETDRILDKISKKGYDSLTKKEKEFLFKQKKD